MARGDNNQVVYVDGDIPQLPLQLGQLLVDSSQVSPGTTNLQQCTSQSPLVYEPVQGGYPINPAETAAGVVIYNDLYPPGWLERYHDPADGSDYTNAANAALSVNQPVYIGDNTYDCNNLVQTHDLQRIYGVGKARLRKNANGTLIASSGDDVEFNGVALRGGDSGPDFTGDGIVMTGINGRLINCGSRYMTGRAVKMTGNHAQIIGTCDIYQTSDATAAGYDIEIGQAGVLTLYHTIIDIYTSSANGGILTTDTGSTKIIGSLFGKLTVANGTGPAGVNGGNHIGNRILGAVTVGVSNSVFAGNTFGAVAITFSGGTGGHTFDSSNFLQSGATLTDSSTLSVVENRTLVPYQTYTSTWTAASVNPAIGDGAITSYYSAKGREITVFIQMVAGASTTFGTGAWFFSLPAIPNTSLPCIGSAQVFDSGTNFRTGISKTLTDGTARIQAIIDADTAAVDSGRPMAWASGDVLIISCTYFTN